MEGGRVSIILCAVICMDSAYFNWTPSCGLGSGCGLGDIDVCVVLSWIYGGRMLCPCGFNVFVFLSFEYVSRPSWQSTIAASWEIVEEEGSARCHTLFPNSRALLSLYFLRSKAITRRGVSFRRFLQHTPPPWTTVALCEPSVFVLSISKSLGWTARVVATAALTLSQSGGLNWLGFWT